MIELKNVTKQYAAGDNTVEALKGISIAFRACEFVSILGPSGGGKTTLLNIVGGLDHYTDGDLIINGTSTKDFKDREWDSYRNHTVGFVFQSYNLIPHQSVLANVELALTLSGVSRSQRRAMAIESLEAVGLGDQINKNPNQLSGGQMQRVAIARALVNNPDVILADEPTGALDTQTSVQVMDILKKVAQQRLVIMVTHNPDLAKQYSTRIVNLIDGQIVGDSNPYQEAPITDAEAENAKLSKKPSMSIFTAFVLSLNNLLSKKGRTILTALAGSIGIIGIALIMALSTGVNQYIEDVETQTLSSYPLTINTSSIDLTSMMTSTMTGGTTGNVETTEGVLTENKVIGDMFATVASNDLKDFKEYLEANQEVVDRDALAVQYGYSLTPQIYKYDTTGGAVRLNPSTAFSSITSLMGSSTYSYSSLYQEMVDDDDMLQDQYKVVAGHWPQKYDEVVLILNKEGVIADLVEYMIGLRDQDELAEMMKVAQNGGTYEVPDSDHTFTYTYDEILNLKFKLVNGSDYYKYNSQYEVWEDMSDDESYLKDLVNSGLTLNVVGIIVPADGSTLSSLTSGIGYTKELTDYMISYSSKTEITKQQLANENTNVFNGLSFEESNGAQNAKDVIDLQDFFTIDQDKIAKAFGSKVSADDISKLVSGYISSTIGSISISTDTAYNDMLNLMKQLNTGLLGSILNGADSGSVDTANAASIAGSYIASASAQTLITGLLDSYQVPATAQSTFSAGLTAVYSGFAAQFLGSGIIPDPFVSGNVATYAGIFNTSAADSFKTTTADIAQQLTEIKIKMSVSSSMAGMASDLSTTIGGGITVDADAFAAAINIDMDEDTLTRVITSYVNSGSNTTYSANLAKLGYADAQRPTVINIYLKDFNAKEDFMDFVDAYNDSMNNSGHSEKAIKYTDIAGSIISSVKTIVDVISYVLIAFVAISLVVSSIMIGIITYISVLERTKEIGLLRAMGASKHDVTNVFNAETFIEGLTAGVMGVVISALLCIPISLIVRHVTGINSLTASLPLANALFLVLISVALTLIAGSIPARMAAKKDPVTALRTE